LSGRILEQILLKVYGLVSARIDLHRGIIGEVYRALYFVYKRWTDRHLIRWARFYARPGTVVIDVGANIGFFSWYVATRTPASVIAFEPEATNFVQLQHLVESRKLSRVVAECIALSNVNGRATLYLSDLAPTDHKLVNTRSSRAVEVPTARLDDYLAGDGPCRKLPVALVKIDVQGAELMVLDGMRQTLLRHSLPPVLTEFSPTDLAAASIAPERLLDAFEELGYGAFLLNGDGPLNRSQVMERARDEGYLNLLMRHIV
jgi:FkbM family methyltransferase